MVFLSAASEIRYQKPWEGKLSNRSLTEVPWAMIEIFMALFGRSGYGELG